MKMIFKYFFNSLLALLTHLIRLKFLQLFIFSLETSQNSFFSRSRTMSVSRDSDNSRPYTIGFSIAVILILLIAIFHLWRILFKQIKKCVNRDELGTIVEVSSDFNGTRRISKKCIHKLEVKLVCDDIEGGLKHVEKRTIINNNSEDGQTLNFLAGYSHQHIDSNEL